MMDSNHASGSAFPLRPGGEAGFAIVRRLLGAARFDQRNVLAALRIPALSELGSLERRDIDLTKLPSDLGQFIRLFILGETVGRAEFEAAFEASARQALLALDLVREGGFAGGGCYSPVFFYPVEEFWIASDRQSHADGSLYVPPQDMVFAAVFPGTQRFLRGIPPRPVDDALDLCSGTGIGALKLSRHAKRAVASDITGRSAHFMRFNAALNGCRNVEVAVGDLYAAVAGRTFDLIIAHPPYVPSLGDHMIFRDGGEAGETILRRIVEGLSESLRPGGLFYSMAVGLDTQEGRFEERVRRWLGAAHEEFDVLFAAGDEKSPVQAVHDIAERARSIRTLDAGQLLQSFEKLGTQRLNYGALAIRRRGNQPAAPWTTRPRLSVDTAGEDFDWAFAWHDRSSQPGFAASLALATPALAPHLQVKVTHVVEEGSLVPAEFMLEASRPFSTFTKLDGWVVPLLARFDGRRTVREVHASAHAAGETPAAFALEDFARLVGLLIERGCLVLQPLPAGTRE